MTTIQRRVAVLEGSAQHPNLTPHEQRQHMDSHYRRHGTTRERVVSEYGSEAEYAYLLMVTPTGSEKPLPHGTTASDVYLRMISK